MNHGARHQLCPSPTKKPLAEDRGPRQLKKNSRSPLRRNPPISTPPISSHRAKSTAMLRQANPGVEAAQDTVTFEHVIQSIYLSAIMAMGAGTEPGQQPRIDIVGARQSIDMLAVLQEKTKGNLTEKEQRLLQNALSSTCA